MPYNMVMVIMVLKSSRVSKSPARDEKSISIKQMQRVAAESTRVNQ